MIFRTFRECVISLKAQTRSNIVVTTKGAGLMTRKHTNSLAYDSLEVAEDGSGAAIDTKKVLRNKLVAVVIVGLNYLPCLTILATMAVR